MTTETNIANAAADSIESKDATDTIPEIPMRVLKVGTASSLSNRSTLGYAIACDESNAIYLSIRSNTAAGLYSPKWVAFLEIANALVHADRITGNTLQTLYVNTSRNNAGFMLAVLLEEGLVCPSDRHYVRQDFKPFQQHINALIAAGVDLGDADLALEALETVVDVSGGDVPEVNLVEVPAAKRGRPPKRA